MVANLPLLFGRKCLWHHRLEKKQCCRFLFRNYPSSQKILPKTYRNYYIINNLSIFYHTPIYRFCNSGKRVIFNSIKCCGDVAHGKKICATLVCLVGSECHLCDGESVSGTLFFSSSFCCLFFGLYFGAFALAKTCRKIDRNQQIKKLQKNYFQ